MSKRIRVVDEITGVTEFDQQIDGGYSIQYTMNTDNGGIHIFGRITNGKYGDRHWIKNGFYEPTARKLIEKYDELRHVNVYRILFIEDMEFVEKSSTKDRWIARIKKANKELEEAWGYRYILETRNYYVEKLSDEQLVAVIYHELRHIGKYDDIRKHDIEDWSNMVETFGQDWTKEHRSIPDLLDKDFTWGSQRKRQLSLADFADQKTAKAQ